MDWGEVVARVPMAPTRARVKSQEEKAMGRAMEQEAGGEYLEDLLRSSPFLLDKSRTSNLVSRQTMSELHISKSDGVVLVFEISVI